MLRAKNLFALTVAVSVSAFAMAAPKQPTEAQCRDMVDAMVSAMKSAPTEDKQGAQVLIDRVEKIIKENRASGISECESWTRIAKIIATH